MDEKEKKRLELLKQIGKCSEVIRGNYSAIENYQETIKNNETWMQDAFDKISEMNEEIEKAFEQLNELTLSNGKQGS